MPAEQYNPEQQPEMSFLTPEEVIDLASRAYLAPESFDGAQRHSLRGDGITLDPNQLEPLGENGPLVVLEIGNQRALKLYGHKREGKWSFAITPGNYINDEITTHMAVQNLVFIDHSMTFGRDVDRTKRALGLTKDSAVSRNHFVIEPSDDQIRVQDISSNGTKITLVEKRQPDFADAYHKAYQARKLGGIVVPKQG